MTRIMITLTYEAVGMVAGYFGTPLKTLARAPEDMTEPEELTDISWNTYKLNLNRLTRMFSYTTKHDEQALRGV